VFNVERKMVAMLALSLMIAAADALLLLLVRHPMRRQRRDPGMDAALSRCTLAIAEMHAV
jgi:hypothetical protein